MAGFITKARQETGADNPKFGGGGAWVDVDAMVAREAVFGITRVEWDGENMYDGKPRPRWVLDIIPWYEGETLPGKADDSGRLQQLEAAKLSLASHRSRDDFMDQLQSALENAQAEDQDYVEGPGILVKIRVPGGKGGRYTDLCEWDEENERPILSKGTEAAPDDEDEPRRPTGRSAPARRQEAPAARSGARRRQAESEGDQEEPEPDPPARAGGARRGGASRRSSASTSAEEGAVSQRAGSSGFAAAGGAESGGSRPAPAPARGDATATNLPISAADLKIVSDVVGGDPYRNEQELAEEYELAEGVAFPGSEKVGTRLLTGIKKWLHDHGIDDFPEGRGKIKPAYRDAYSIALRAWMEATGRDAEGNPVEDGPESSGSVDEPEYVPGGPDHGTGYNSGDNAQPRRRTVREAAVPENAREANDRTRPQGADDVDPQGQSRAAGKAAWMPPDQRERGPQPASEHVYDPNDVGDSVEPCPDCNQIATARAFPMGNGSYGIVHECPVSGATKPLQATNIRKG